MKERRTRVEWIPSVSLALLGVIAACTGSRALASDDADFEYWAKASFLIPVTESWTFKFDQKFNFLDEARRLDSHQQDFGVVYSGLADWIDLSVCLKQKFAKDGDDWERENRPHFNVKLKSSLFGCPWTNRSRLEYRDAEDDQIVWRFRHKTALKSPDTFTPWKIQPYVAEEVFIQLDDEDVNANRISAGLYVPLAERIRLELFYAWHIDEEPDSWHDTNLIASYVRFKF